MSWYDIQSPKTEWLVDGLITSDGYAAICGKPKAGKSTFVRNLIVSVIKSRMIIGRLVNIPAGTGRVLYIHLDRKDKPHRVVAELKRLGITKEESVRLALRTEEHVPKDSSSERLKWIKEEITTFKPHLTVIDLMWQFVIAGNSNDYNVVLKGINDLQDALSQQKYQGALIVTLHGRKATNPNEPFDDVLGSTGQRGSFSTNVLLTRYRKESVYTIQSDQTERDDRYGEISETILGRNSDGTLSLLRPFNELLKEEKETRDQAALKRVLNYIENNPAAEMFQIMGSLGMAKKTILRLLNMAPELWRMEGAGEKGDPHRYFPTLVVDPQVAAKIMEAKFVQ